MRELEGNNTVYVFGEFSLYVSERCLVRGGQRTDLTPRNFQLLLKLVQDAGHLIEKETLLNEVWKDANVEEGNLARTVSNLRKILGDPKEKSIYIQTVPRVGYRFIAEVTEKLAERAEGAEKSLKNRSREKYLTAKTMLAIAILLMFIASVFAVVNWQNRSRNNTAESFSRVEAHRLTNTAPDEQIVGWTNDGRLRFVRRISNNVAQSLVMNADGSNQIKEGFANLQFGVWSPKGDRVVYSKAGDPSNDFYYLARGDGSDEIRLPLKAENAMWSSDGEKIIFQSDSAGSNPTENYEIYIYEIRSRRLHLITNSPGFDGDPAFSPDGSEIVFVSNRTGSYEIYLMNIDGGNLRRLTTNSAHDSFPRFTPDGTGITFSSNLNGESTDIYFVNANGGNPVRLTSWNSNELSRASCSPDGTKIAFNSDINGNDEIYVMDLEPDRVKQLLSDSSVSLQTPSFSADGKQLVYSAELADKTGELRILGTDGSRGKTILNTTSGSTYPRFSPDGQRIAFHQEAEGRWDIFTVNSDGSELKNLTQNTASDSIPNWMRNGQRLIFRTNREGGSLESEFYSMAWDGKNQLPLETAAGSVGWPSVSPDGEKLIFSCDRENDKIKLLDICIASIDGSNETVFLSKADNDMQPVFSPDGKRIAFVATSDGNPEIYLINIDGTGLYRLTRNAAKDLNPVFSPDGRAIVFSSDRNGKPALYQIDLSDR